MNKTREYLVLVVNSHVALVSRHSVKNHECSVDWCIISLFNNMVKFDCYFYYRISIILFEFFHFNYLKIIDTFVCVLNYI